MSLTTFTIKGHEHATEGEEKNQFTYEINIHGDIRKTIEALAILVMEMKTKVEQGAIHEWDAPTKPH